MRPSRLLGCLILVVPLAAAAPAAAAVPHVVGPGDTLWSIAAAHNLTTRTVAAYNGLSPESAVVLGQHGQGPLRDGGRRRAAAAGRHAGRDGHDGHGGHDRPERRRRARPRWARYKVRPGDTLSQLAATARVSASAIATMNGLSVDGPLVAGTVHQAPDGRPRARPRRPPGTRQDDRAPGGPDPDAPRASTPGRSSRSPPSTGSRRRWPPRSAGRRAASTTRWSRAPTRAGSCR